MKHFKEMTGYIIERGEVMESLCTREDAEDIVDRYANLVYTFALSQTRRKDVAEDVFQEVFLRYVKKHPTFQNEEHARAWFFTVTKNCCRNHFSSFFEKNTMALVEDIPVLREETSGLYFYVLQLPRKYRLVIHLFYYEGLSTIQIASLLHKKDATIRTQLKRARALLKENMKGCEIDEIL